jgi:hypothetical protein
MHPVSLIALLTASASASASTRQSAPVNQNVIPKTFGVTAREGKDKIQVGSCLGANNALIPCYCPPAPDSPEFLTKLAKAPVDGFIFSKAQVALPSTLAKFNNESDRSAETNKLRATAMIEVMQNYNMTTQGVGCPGVSFPVLGRMQQTGIVARGVKGLGNGGR